MAGTKLVGDGLSLYIAILLVEAHAFIASGDGNAEADDLVSGTHPIGNVYDFIAAFFPFANAAAQRTECLQKESFDEMGLELMRFHAFHFLANGHDFMDVHGILGQCALFEQIAQGIAVHGFVHYLIEFCPCLGGIAIADGLDQQVAQALIFEGYLAENVKDLSAESVAFLLQLFEEPLIDGAFAGLLGNQIP